MDAKTVARHVKRNYLNALKWEVFADVIPALTELAELGWKHIILSNHVQELAGLVSQLKLAEYFVDVVSSANVGVEKPHPEAFRRVSRTLPVQSQCWMVGDNVTADIDGANSVGIDAILVRKHHSSVKYVSENLLGVAPVVDAV